MASQYFYFRNCHYSALELENLHLLTRKCIVSYCIFGIETKKSMCAELKMDLIIWKTRSFSFHLNHSSCTRDFISLRLHVLSVGWLVLSQQIICSSSPSLVKWIQLFYSTPDLKYFTLALIATCLASSLLTTSRKQYYCFGCCFMSSSAV